MTATVNEIIAVPFSERTCEDQMRIVSRYKPRPRLRLNYQDENGVLKKADFDRKIYNEIIWLTGCDKRNKMYCWPCLLYMKQSIWTSGIDDLKFVTEHHGEHAKEANHLDAIFKLHYFIKQQFEDPTAIYNLGKGEMNISEYDRPVLNCLIKAICTAIIIDDSNNEKLKCDTLEVNECIHMAQLQRSKSCHPGTVTDLIVSSPEIINDIVDAISMVLKGVIKDEMEESLFASIILTEHLTCKEKSQISTVLRYVKNGEVCERFIGFTNTFRKRRQIKNITRHIVKVKKDFNIQDKILIIAVDGAVLQAPQISKLSDPNTSLCKYLIPSYFHGFGHVLLQSVSHFENCGLFFKTFKAIESYFENKAHFHKLESAMLERLPNLKKNKWYTTSPFIAFFAIYRKYFHEYFTNELAYSTFISGDDRVKIMAFKSFLEDLKTIFLLKTFAKIFADYFNKRMDFIVDIFELNFDSELMKFYSKMVKFQKSGFAKLWIDSNVDKIGEKHPDATKIAAFEENPDKKTYAALFKKIMNQIQREIETRRSDMLRLAFSRLFTCNSEGEHEFKKLWVSLLLYELAPHFDEITLNNEIRVFNDELSQMFKNKKVHGFMEIFKEYEFCDVLSQLYRAIEFILTLPCIPPSKDSSYEKSKIKQIKDLSYMPLENNAPSGETSILRIEKHMLKDLIHSRSFYANVIQKYCEIQMNR